MFVCLAELIKTTRYDRIFAAMLSRDKILLAGSTSIRRLPVSPRTLFHDVVSRTDVIQTSADNLMSLASSQSTYSVTTCAREGVTGCSSSSFRQRRSLFVFIASTNATRHTRATMTDKPEALTTSELIKLMPCLQLRFDYDTTTTYASIQRDSTRAKNERQFFVVVVS